jgi:hypothetical protein
VAITTTVPAIQDLAVTVLGVEQSLIQVADRPSAQAADQGAALGQVDPPTQLAPVQSMPTLGQQRFTSELMQLAPPAGDRLLPTPSVSPTEPLQNSVQPSRESPALQEQSSTSSDGMADEAVSAGLIGLVALSGLIGTDTKTRIDWSATPKTGLKRSAARVKNTA